MIGGYYRVGGCPIFHLFFHLLFSGPRGKVHLSLGSAEGKEYSYYFSWSDREEGGGTGRAHPRGFRRARLRRQVAASRFSKGS